MDMENPTLKRQVLEKVIRVVIAIAGLLILRAIVSVMPMLKTDPVYVATSPALSSTANAPLTVDRIIQALANTPLQTAVLEAESALQGVNRGWTPQQIQNEFLIRLRLAIFPVTIAKAVIDTLMFVLLVVFGQTIAGLFHAAYLKLPGLGQMISFGIMVVLAALAYRSYQGLAYPLLFPDDLSVYGWVFLIVVLAPLVALAVLVARNLDAITAIVMQSGSSLAPAPVVAACGNCGQPMTRGARFCPHCAAPAGEVRAAASGNRCVQCGALNSPGDRFCKGCGQLV